MAVVYQHRRKDNNQVFYIGVGQSKERAYSKHSRSDYWYSVVSKAGDYGVELLFENIPIEDAFAQEVKLIAELGRSDLGLGPLVNMTDGGEGTLGRLYSDEDKEIMRQRMLGINNHMYGKSGDKHNRYGKHHSTETKQRIAEAVSGINNARYGKPNVFLSNRNDEVVKGSIWVTNGVDELRLANNTTIPVGYEKGRNTTWITDGNVNKIIPKNEILPIGFKKGRTIKNNKKQQK